jgi:hypothetical protein
MTATLKMSPALALALAGVLALAGCGKPPTNATTANAAASATDTSNAPAATNTAAATTPTATGSDAADVKAFLDGIYAHYQTNKDPIFQPFNGNAKEVLDADTIALFKADQKVLNGQGVGAIDGDWLCDCQDFESITATITVQSASATEAKATSDFHDTPPDGGTPKHDTFDLVKTPAGWRIHDIGTADQPSLRKVLTDEIAGLKSGKIKPDSDSAP